MKNTRRKDGKGIKRTSGRKHGKRTTKNSGRKDGRMGREQREIEERKMDR